MVTKTQARRKQDIKSKLMAAIAMLLVSSIMMVSSTYAWFTLSTAPEVTGISTAVGANGNLEIALLPKTGDTNDISSAVGDSVLGDEEKNVTWGNLVDLSESSIYGLDAITLYPSAINYSGDSATSVVAAINKASLLRTPQYGSDGRVASLTPNTDTGYYNPTVNSFYPNPEQPDAENEYDGYGVRAVGTASGMTERQLAYRNALSTANTATASAKTIASQSLSNNGSALANIVVKKATDGENATFNNSDIKSLIAIAEDLIGNGTKTGALQAVDKAYVNYILAYAASAAAGSDETAELAYQPIQTAVTDGNTAKQIADSFGLYVPSGLSTAIDALETTKADVNKALNGEGGSGGLKALENETSVTWDQISTSLYLLADIDNITVCGYKADQVMANVSEIVNKVLGGEGIKVEMASGAGVYADIADHCGNYKAPIVIDEIKYNNIGATNVKAQMETKSSVSTAYLAAASDAVTGAGAPSSGNAADKPLTDMYGYVIDLAFRTNAAESNLLLQQEAVDRIYSDNANDGTMGNGSNMTFNITANGLTVAQLKDLMGAIRIVFFTEGDTTYNVVAAGKLDLPENMADILTAEGGYKANIVLGSIDGNGGFTPKTEDANVLMPLTQNTAHQLSVLVYLDGNLVGNEDVAAQAATSMTGKLNLQFASSANLVPMDYSQLHTPSATGTGTGGGTSGDQTTDDETQEPVTP